MAVAYIAASAASDYAAFTQFCNRYEFPKDFGAFCRLVERRKNNYRARGFIAREVEIDIAGFKRRRRSGKRATYRDLDRYAARLVYRKQRRK
jgi:hypothetical protein